MTLASTISLVLSSLTVFGQVIIAYLCLVLILGKKAGPFFGKPAELIRKHAVAFALVVTLAALFGSLAYSDVLMYEPCKLCWYQRIFMYPSALLLGLALFWKDRSVIPYVIVFAVIGQAVAIYHYVVQLGVFPAPCSVSGYSVSCAKVFTLNFGYITIPLMAFTAFILIALSLAMSRKQAIGQ